MALNRFFRRQLVVPFETSFAVFCVYTGVTGAIPYGLVSRVFEQALGRKLSLAFCAVHVAAGVALYFGIGLNRRNTEAFGLILIIGSLLIRTLAVFAQTGINPSIAGIYTYSLLFTISATIRLYSLITGITIVETRPIRIK